MVKNDWNDFAADLTGYIREHWPGLHRGAVMMPCIDHAATFALIFANNELHTVEAVQLEVDLIREHLHDGDIEDLGFGTSSDGNTWVLVVRLDGSQQQTEAGRTLQRELLKIRLEEVVQKAWLEVYSRIAQDVLVRIAG